jgi:predicted PurR-regulated permease PerM
MSKLELISELLVNELTDFEKDVTRLEESISKAEILQVTFNVKPVEGLISRLEDYASQEDVLRRNYLRNLQQNLEKAKIYPSWAVISFFVLVLLSCFLSFYVYQTKSELNEKVKAAYTKGESAANEYINLYLSENPKALEQYKKWAESK